MTTPGPLAKLARAWDDYFFAPAAATDLAVSRAVVCGLLLLYYLPVDFAGWATVPRAAWLPMWAFKALHVGVLPHGPLLALEWAWKASLLLACVGLLTRPATAVAFVAGAYLLGLPHNFGKVNHYDALAVFVLGVLAFSRCGDAWSLDRLIRRRRDPAVPATPAPSGEYRWPVRAAWVVFAAVFFSAGYSKVTMSGVAWVTSDHMTTVLLKEQYNNDPLVAWGAWIARHPPLPNLFAASALALELGYPLALFSRRARLAFVPGMFLAQLGIRVLMGPAFWPFLICNAFWVPWDYVWPFARRASTTPETNAASRRALSPQL